MYDILIDYTTGDSFHSERITEESLGIVVSDVDKAKINLNRIKEHYKKYSDSPNSGDYYTLELLTDMETRVIYPFWIGYFETLHGAKIVNNNDEMSFSLEEW